MKKLCLLLLLSIGCANVQLPFDPRLQQTIQHTEVKKVYFDIEDNELVWSRLHSYIYIYLGYPATDTPSPYFIHVRVGNLSKEIIIAREIDRKRVRIIISYTDGVKTKRIQNKSKSKSKYIKDPDDVVRMSNLIADMIEYARSGNHKRIPIKIEKENNKNADNDKDDGFFFY